MHAKENAGQKGRTKFKEAVYKPDKMSITQKDGL